MMNNSPQEPEISVVILCYKTRKNIIPFVDKVKRNLDKKGITWEIILVGNYNEGSKDKTPYIVREIASTDNRIFAVTKVKRGGMGWDMKSGLVESQGKTIAVIDGDGQMPAKDIVRVYEKLKSGDFDLVKTYRTKREDSLYRTGVSVIYNFVFKILFFGLEAKDMNSKPKILTRNAYNKLKLKSDNWFIDAEIMIKARRYYFKIGEVPTVFHKIDSRLSFIRIPSVLEFIKNLVLARIKEFKYR